MPVDLWRSSLDRVRHDTWYAPTPSVGTGATTVDGASWSSSLSTRLSPDRATWWPSGSVMVTSVASRTTCSVKRSSIVRGAAARLAPSAGLLEAR